MARHCFEQNMFWLECCELVQNLFLGRGGAGGCQNKPEIGKVQHLSDKLAFSSRNLENID